MMDDYPVVSVPADILNWSENFCLAGYDPAAGIDIYLHMGRWRKDTSLWRELVAIALPDGSVIAHRAIGNARAADQSPGGPNMRICINEPCRHFTWEFLGGARRVLAQYLRDHILEDGPQVRTSFTFDYISELPAWDIGEAGHGSEMIGRGHVEQIGRARGTIHVGNETYSFDSFVNRDHSRGPRVLGGICGSLWMQGVLPGEIFFHVYEAQEGQPENTVMSEACVIVAGILHPATFESGFHFPLSNAIELIKSPVPFTLTYRGGSLSGRIETFPSTVFCQFTSPADSYIGARQLPGGSNSRYLQQSIEFVLEDGRRGFGHAERTVPGITIADPA